MRVRDRVVLGLHAFLIHQQTDVFSIYLSLDEVALCLLRVPGFRAVAAAVPDISGVALSNQHARIWAGVRTLPDLQAVICAAADS